MPELLYWPQHQASDGFVKALKLCVNLVIGFPLTRFTWNGTPMLYGEARWIMMHLSFTIELVVDNTRGPARRVTGLVTCICAQAGTKSCYLLCETEALLHKQLTTQIRCMESVPQAQTSNCWIPGCAMFMLPNRAPCAHQPWMDILPCHCGHVQT